MRDVLAAGLRRTALVAREVAALGAVLLGVRILWLSAESGLTHSRAIATASPGGPAGPQTERPRIQNPQRPDLEQLRALVGEEAPSEEPPTAPPVPILRRILVDLGPARSEVFIGKKLVGQTPYGGQIACTLGEALNIHILPPEGVPIERRIVCRGETLLVRE